MRVSEAGRAGRVEKFLVFGILVVIGLILVVAINGARKIEDDQAVAKASEEESPGEDARDAERRAERRAAERGSGSARGPDTALQRNQPGGNPAGNQVGGGSASRGGAGGTRGSLDDPPRNSGRSESLANRDGPGSDPSSDRLDSVRDSVMEMLVDVGDGAGRAANAGAGAGRRPGPETISLSPTPASTSGTSGSGSRSTGPDSERGDVGTEVAAEVRGQVAGGTGDDSGKANRKAPPGKAGQDWIVVIKPGDSLISLSRRYFGSEQYWPEMMAANPWLTDASLLQVGQKLALPPHLAPLHTKGLQQGKSSARPARVASTKLAAASSSTGANYRRLVADSQHKVRRGDTLMTIAQNAYGTKSAWKLIFDANRDKLRSENRIVEGQVLRLPEG